MTACVVGDADTEEPDDEGDAEPVALAIESGAAPEDFASIAQINPYYGGRFSTLDIHGAETYQTGRRMARFIATSWPRVSVIGLEEIENAANADKLATIMTEETGHPWTAQHFGRGTQADALPSTEEAVLWRSDVWSVVEVLGTRQVEAIDTSRGPRTLSVRFGGILLQRIGTAHELAMFAGKLVWLGRKRDGVKLDNSDRAREAATLMEWADNKLASHPNATRAFAVDLNADFGAAPWRQFEKQYRDGGDDRPTHWTYGPNRFDGLFVNTPIAGGPYRSASFGSDHRAIAARVRLR
ncbi:MAG TPA: hypothetical protein VL326_04745 [Kofleriaceae bacterium]|jgi:hypothetical protein|nr:hypothetical protein [Kofleriaceae bacterium]